jgi:hypothetical protein
LTTRDQPSNSATLDLLAAGFVVRKESKGHGTNLLLIRDFGIEPPK